MKNSNISCQCQERRRGFAKDSNNLMFHPHKPIYKDHFGAGLDKRPRTGDFYIEIGVEKSLFAGGLWRPSPKVLRSIRDAIDYNGEELKKILNKPSFKKRFGGLYEDEKLKTAPRGFSNDHPHLDLLRHKTFAVSLTFSTDRVFQKDFEDFLFATYFEMLPFRTYLNKALSV